jgi:zinc protease
MFNGSEHYNDEYFRPFEEVGATSMNGTTNSDRTNYFETVPTSAIDLALWMESDRMGHLLGAIDQKKLDEQRGVVQNEKREDDNQPYGKVYAQIVANLFPPGHPYSWETIGSMEDLQRRHARRRQALVPDVLRPEQRDSRARRRHRPRDG